MNPDTDNKKLGIREKNSHAFGADPDPENGSIQKSDAFFLQISIQNGGYGCCLVRAAYVYDRSADVAAAVAGWAEGVGAGGPPTAQPPRPPADLHLLACCTAHAPRGVLHQQRAYFSLWASLGGSSFMAESFFFVNYVWGCWIQICWGRAPTTTCGGFLTPLLQEAPGAVHKPFCLDSIQTASLGNQAPYSTLL